MRALRGCGVDVADDDEEDGGGGVADAADVEAVASRWDEAGEGTAVEVLNECLDEHTPHVDDDERADAEGVAVVLVDRPLWKFWIMPCWLLDDRRDKAERAADAMAWLPLLLLPAAMTCITYPNAAS